MTEPQTQEQQKVAEWMEAQDFEPMYSTNNPEEQTAWWQPANGLIVFLDVATFFYRAARPEPVAGDEELTFDVLPDIFRSIGPGDDVVVSAEKLRNWRDELKKSTAQRILDRVEAGAPNDWPTEDIWRRTVARIRKEEL